jgi:two-component system osmolarity sensor histidine kinase EnvZ
MEMILKDFIDFAKSNDSDKVVSQVNISDILRSIVAGYRKDHDKIILNISSGISLHLNPNSFRRAVVNIIDNALRYASKLKIQIGSSDKYVTIFFDDNGPGIPVKKRNLVFKPFYRIDNSRNSETGGSGLGLAITRDIINSYGGKITLDNSAMGGLRVIIMIPK